SASLLARDRLAEEAWTVPHRFDGSDPDPHEIGMPRIDETVMLPGCEGRGNKQDAVRAASHKRIAELSEFERRGRRPPGARQITGADFRAAEVLGHIGYRQDKIIRRIVGVEVDKIFQQGQGLVLRGVAEAHSRAGPTAAVAEGA